jgi:hypothetical protein
MKLYGSLSVVSYRGFNQSAGNTKTMVKTVDERHQEARIDPGTLPPCENEAECRKAAQSGEPHALLALAQALIDDSIEHQDPDEALKLLERARQAAGSDAETINEWVTIIEARVHKKKHELGEAQQLEMMHNEDA